MSKIFEHGRFVIQVWPLDHRPVHCHVTIDGELEIKVSLPDYAVEIVSRKAPSTNVIKEIIEIVKDHKNPIGQEWRRLHGN